MTDKNGYVRYPFFIGTILGSMGTMLTIISLLFIVSNGKFEQFEKRVDGNFDTIGKNIDLIREDIKGLR